MDRDELTVPVLAARRRWTYCLPFAVVAALVVCARMPIEWAYKLQAG